MPGTSQARPGDPLVPGPGQERRDRLKEPAQGEGRHSLWAGESSRDAGEERQVGRRKDVRDWPDDPEPRDGDGEGTRSRGEERQDGRGRVGEEKVWPEPEPGEGDLRGDGEGTRSRGENHRDVRVGEGRRGEASVKRRRQKQKDYSPTWLFPYENWDTDLCLASYQSKSECDAVSDFNYFCWQGPGGIKNNSPLPGNLQPVASSNKKVYFAGGVSSSINLLSACFPPQIMSNLSGIEETPRYVLIRPSLNQQFAVKTFLPGRRSLFVHK